MTHIIKRKFSTLLKCMEPSNKLLGELRSVAFVESRIPFIEQQATPDDKNHKILTVLLEVPGDQQKSVMTGFITALRSCGQDHVANIFRVESNKVPMSDEHRKMLTSHLDELCNFMDPENGLLIKLTSLRVITVDIDRKIRNRDGFHEMVRELIYTILRKSDDTFQTLVKTLNETGQNRVAYILTGRGDSQPLSEDDRERG